MSVAPRFELVRDHILTLHAAALDAAHAGRAVRRHLFRSGSNLVAGGSAIPLPPSGRVLAIAFGKASLEMARAALEVFPDPHGLIVAHPLGMSPGEGWPAVTRRFAAGHPFPDLVSLAAGDAVLGLLADTKPEDIVLLLISGGGSALLESLRPGVELAEVVAATRALMAAGADIKELNRLRARFSRLKAGGLLRLAAPARVVALLLSDVPGDDPAVLASGTTIAGDAAPALNVLVGSNADAVRAAVQAARELGFEASAAGFWLEGEAREVGARLGTEARASRGRRPSCLVYGGESTVTLKGAGRGGRTLELALGAALAIDGCPGVCVAGLATDGDDGSSGAAGAWVTGETARRARGAGLSIESALCASDSYPLLQALDALLVTGHTGTNVADLVIVLAY